MALLERVAAGDQSAVELCIREYGGLVYRLARRHLDHALEEVDDAVQNVFIEVWTSAKRFDPAKGSEAAFVATIAHRRLIDHQRRVTSRRRTARNAEPTLKKSASERGMQAGAAGEDSAITAAYNKLPESEREALRMSVYGGLTHHEIGIATDAPIGTVKSRLRRAMMRLRESIAPCCVGADQMLCEGGES